MDLGRCSRREFVGKAFSFGLALTFCSRGRADSLPKEPVMEDDLELLSEHFTVGEFKCPCGCNICNVSPRLLKKLEDLRQAYGGPLKINSGCRCPSHNASIGGEVDSKHITTPDRQCMAADLHAPLGSDKYKLIKSALLLGFRGIGIADSYIHIDLRQTSEAWFWRYADVNYKSRESLT